MNTAGWWDCTNAEDEERRRLAATSTDAMDEEREVVRALYEQHQAEDLTCSYSHSWLFEGSPTWPPMQVVFEANGDDLMDADTLKAICAFNDDLRVKYNLENSAENSLRTGEYCEERSLTPMLPCVTSLTPLPDSFRSVAGGQKCLDRNLGHYIGYYYHKTCAEITSSDVENFRTLLTTCQPSFTAGTLTICSDIGVPNNCMNIATNNTSPAVPKECLRENIVYDVLANIVDKDFKTTNKVKYTKVIGAYTWEDQLTPVHDDLESDLDKSYGSAKITGYRLGDKFDVFTSQLIIDNIYSGGAFFLVFCIMWLHTSSGFIASFGFLQIILNLGVAYGIYMAVLNLPFFPFLNLVGIFVVVGIGADDVFVFMDCWKQTVLVFGENARLADRMGYVLYRAGGSMLITSLTTGEELKAHLIHVFVPFLIHGVSNNTVSTSYLHRDSLCSSQPRPSAPTHFPSSLRSNALDFTVLLSSSWTTSSCFPTSLPWSSFTRSTSGSPSAVACAVPAAPSATSPRTRPSSGPSRSGSGTSSDPSSLNSSTP